MVATYRRVGERGTNFAGVFREHCPTTTGVADAGAKGYE
jgi:hypothetical protein